MRHIIKIVSKTTEFKEGNANEDSFSFHVCSADFGGADARLYVVHWKYGNSPTTEDGFGHGPWLQNGLHRWLPGRIRGFQQQGGERFSRPYGIPVCGSGLCGHLWGDRRLQGRLPTRI